MDDRDNDPVDLSALGPVLGADRMNQLVKGALARSIPELERRRRAGVDNVVHVMVAWRRQLLTVSGLAAAAAVIAALSLPARTVAPTLWQGSSPANEESVSISEALGVPAAYVESVEGHASPSVVSGRVTP